jgi:hypothetical protein
MRAAHVAEGRAPPASDRSPIGVARRAGPSPAARPVEHRFGLASSRQDHDHDVHHCMDRPWTAHRHNSGRFVSRSPTRLIGSQVRTSREMVRRRARRRRPSYAAGPMKPDRGGFPDAARPLPDARLPAARGRGRRAHRRSLQRQAGHPWLASAVVGALALAATLMAIAVLLAVGWSLEA